LETFEIFEIYIGRYDMTLYDAQQGFFLFGLKIFILLDESK